MYICCGLKTESIWIQKISGPPAAYKEVPTIVSLASAAYKGIPTVVSLTSAAYKGAPTVVGITSAAYKVPPTVVGLTSAADKAFSTDKLNQYIEFSSNF